MLTTSSQTERRVISMVPAGKHGRALRAFTILEVVLALAIATSILAVVLYFYRQAENLRTQLLQVTSQTTGARLILERLTGELTVAQLCGSMQQGLSGGPDNIQFVKLDVPGPSAWTNNADTNLIVPVSPYHLITYALGASPMDSNVVGLVRTEGSLLTQRPAAAVDSEFAETNSPSYGQTNDLTAAQTNDVTIAQTNAHNNFTNAPSDAVTNALALRQSVLLTDQLQFLRFRYCDGTNWLDSWSGPDLPLGVEINLGVEPLPQGSNVETYNGELFRRVIYLPNHGTNAAPNLATSTAASIAP
jgi:hypothetical protein